MTVGDKLTPQITFEVSGASGNAGSFMKETRVVSIPMLSCSRSKPSIVGVTFRWRTRE